MPDAIAPDGSEIYFKVLDAHNASLVEVMLRGGLTTRAVRHRTVEEIWYFLDGSGLVWLRSPDRAVERNQSVSAGNTVVIPTGWDFQFQATGPDPLRFLCYTAPSWPGEQEAMAVTDGGLGEPDV